MARQILTFFVLFAGVMLLMTKGCPKESFPPAVSKETVAAPDPADLYVLDDGKGLVVRLDRTGALVSVDDAGTPVVRPVHEGRRPLGLLLKTKEDLLRRLPREGWATAEVPGGRDFTAISEVEFRAREG